MNKINAVIIDDNIKFTEMIEEYFKNNDKINIYKKAYDGVDGIELLEKEANNYDVVILDLIMPNKDGMYVLTEMQKRNIEKRVIVSTSYNANEVIKEVSEMGVSYYILKPYSPEDLEKRILDIMNKKEDTKNIDFENSNLQKSITKILHDLGMPSHIKGYQYIRSAITILFEHPETIGGITKELYPELAERYSTTISRVERAIRHAIEVSWNRSKWDTMVNIFGNSVDVDRSKPTNSEFIVTISDKLRLDYNKINV